MDNGSCIFCKIVRKDIQSKVVFEDSEVMAFEDVKPQAPVHIIIIPKGHIEKVSDLEDRDADLAGRLILRAKDIANRKNIQESGYRIVINCNKDAGQAVFHLHLHLLGGRSFSWPPG